MQPIKKPTEQYWTDCEKRLRQDLQTLEQSPSFIETLFCVLKFLECIDVECGEFVKKLTYSERRYLAIYIASKIMFDTPILDFLNIPHFLSHTYSVKPQ